MTTPAFDLALSACLAQYSEQAQAQLVQAASKASKKPAKVKLLSTTTKAENETKTVSPASNGDKAPVVATKSNAGSVDAVAYLAMMREAGKRRDKEGKPFFDSNEVRNDQIKAIDLFIGYNYGQDFGTQELAARTQAMRHTRKEPLPLGPERPEVRRLQASVTGFVAGTPNNAAAQRANLEARERLAVEALIGFEKQAIDSALTDQERAKAAAFAQLERERIAQIRRDLDVCTG